MLREQERYMKEALALAREAAAALSRTMSRRTCGEDEEGDALWT